MKGRRLLRIRGMIRPHEVLWEVGNAKERDEPGRIDPAGRPKHPEENETASLTSHRLLEALRRVLASFGSFLSEVRLSSSIAKE